MKDQAKGKLDEKRKSKRKIQKEKEIMGAKREGKEQEEVTNE